MKKLMICALLIASNVVFANDYYCPQSITCTRDNDVSSCTINGDSSIFNQINKDSGFHNFVKGNYSLSLARASNSIQFTECIYGSTAPHINMEITIEPNKNMYADYKIQNNNWEIDGQNEGFCNSHDISMCPFSDTPVPLPMIN